MMRNILLSSSSSFFIIKTSGIRLREQEMTWPLLTFLRHLSWVSTENLFCVNQNNYKITSLFPIFKSSVSIANLHKTKEKSIILKEVFNIKFSNKKLLSPCLTLTLLALFYIPNMDASRFPTTEALTAVSTTASCCGSPVYSYIKWQLWGLIVLEFIEADRTGVNAYSMRIKL